MSAPQSESATSDTPLATSRGEVIGALRRLKQCDLLVVGGGIHGAAFAHLAAFNGLRTVLLERSDYAAETSSRSSRMAHGGLRYLEFFDLPQVIDGVRAREGLYQLAPHLVRPTPFLIPVRSERRWERLRFGAGLACYNLLAPRSRGHVWRPRSELTDLHLGLEIQRYAGAYEFYDGVLDDARLTMEHILGARQEGALCLNHAEVEYLTALGAGPVTVKWRDNLTGERYSLEAGVVVNCAGPWATAVRGAEASVHGRRALFSRGVHIIFRNRWKGPALLLPLEGRARYYFVWPHPAGTLVGTTERETDHAERDPLPRPDELQEIFERLQRDLPHAGLDRASAHMCFCGVRTIAQGEDADKPSVLRSRRPQWSFGRGVLTLIGGKLTTAAPTALEGLRMVYKLANIEGRVVTLSGRALPGAADIGGARAEFSARCREFNVPKSAEEYCLTRFGGLVRFITPTRESFTPVGEHLIRGMVEYAISCEQGTTLDDLMWRRLGLAYLPGGGCDVVDEIAAMLVASQSVAADSGLASRASSQYRERIGEIAGLLAG